MGKFLVNFQRRPGDYSGIAGSKEDGAAYTSSCRNANAYGLYNMAGNVSEWVKDAYRAMSSADISNLNGYRGNVFTSDVWTLRTIQYSMTQQEESFKLKKMLKAFKSKKLSSCKCCKLHGW